MACRGGRIGHMKSQLLFAVLCFVALVGCEKADHQSSPVPPTSPPQSSKTSSDLFAKFGGVQTSPPPPPQSAETQPYQRFIPVARQPENVDGVPWSGAFALDTMTGQLCRTFDRNALVGDKTIDYDTLARKYGGTAAPQKQSVWNSLPLCHDLWLKSDTKQ